MNINKDILIVALQLILVMGAVRFAIAASQDPPLTPVEAQTHIGKTIEVQIKPAVIKDRLEKRGEIYMDSEIDFRDERNFAVVITKKGANRFKEMGLADPAKHFKDKEIKAKGLVKEVDGVPRIEVNDPDQISIAEKKSDDHLDEE